MTRGNGPCRRIRYPLFYQQRVEGSPVRLRFVHLFAMGLVLAALAVGCSDAKDSAATLMAEKDYAGAEAAYRQILAQEPDDLEALSGLAVALGLQRKHDEALLIQERVIAADPTDFMTRVELGFNYLNHQGRPNDAVRVFGEAAVLEPSAKNLTFLGQAQASAGQMEDARATLELAIEREPGYEYAYQVLVALLEEQGLAKEAAEVAARAAKAGMVSEDSE